MNDEGTMKSLFKVIVAALMLFFMSMPCPKAADLTLACKGTDYELHIKREINVYFEIEFHWLSGVGTEYVYQDGKTRVQFKTCEASIDNINVIWCGATIDRHSGGAEYRTYDSNVEQVRRLITCRQISEHGAF
jgi:hypothetical protein